MDVFRGDRMPELEEAQKAHMISAGSLTRMRLWGVLAGLQLVLLLAALDQTVVSTAMPHIVSQLNGFDRYAWVTTAYLLTSTVAVPVFGGISDIYGRKLVFLPGIFLFVIASVLCGSAGLVPFLPGMDALIVSRALQGIAAGNMMGLTFTVVGDLFSAADRGRYQGLFAAVFALASLMGPALGGFIADNLSWRFVFYINVPVGLLAMLILYATLPEGKPATSKGPVDYAGVALLLLCLTPLLIALSLVPYSGWMAPPVVALIIVSLLFLVGLLVSQRRAHNPLIPMALFKHSVINISVVSLFVTGIGMFGSLLLLPLFFQSVLEFSAAMSGVLLAPLLVVVAASSVAGGFIISHCKRYKAVTLAGLASMTAGTFMLSRMSASTDLRIIIADMLVVGVGLGLLLPVYTIVIQNEAPKEMLGIATGLSQFFRSMGGTLGTAAFGSLMLSTYRREIAQRLPGELPPGVLSAVDNPLQAIKLKQQLSSVLHGSTAHKDLINSVYGTVKLSLISAIDSVFLIYAVILLVTLILNCLLADRTLKGSQQNTQV